MQVGDFSAWRPPKLQHCEATRYQLVMITHDLSIMGAIHDPHVVRTTAFFDSRDAHRRSGGYQGVVRQVKDF